MPSQNYSTYTYHCPDGHDYEIKVDDNGDAFVTWAGKEFNATGFTFFSEYRYQKEYEKFLKGILLKHKYFYDKKYAINKLGGKCYMCGETDDLNICGLKIYKKEYETKKSSYSKIKEILEDKKGQKIKNYILLCKKDMNNRKKIVIRLINYYEGTKKENKNIFVIPDSVKRYMERLKVSFEVVKFSFPFDNVEIKES